MTTDDKFDDYLKRASEFPELDLGKITPFFRECMPDCSAAQLELIVLTLTNALECPRSLLDRVIDDIRDSADDGTPLRSTEEVADFVLGVLAEQADEHAEPVFDEGRIGIYQAQDNDETGGRAGVWEDCTDIVRGLINDHAGVRALSTKGRRLEALNRVRERLHRPGFFEVAPAGVPLRNGVLLIDPATAETQLVEHSPNFRARFRIDTTYDATAEAPAFERFLEALFPDCEASRAAYCQMLAAAAFNLRPARDDSRSILLLTGPSGSGKSTAAGVGEAIIDPEAISHVDPANFADEKHAMKLAGAALNVVTELARGRALPGQYIKRIASRERITARQLYKDVVYIRPRAINIWCANGLPVIQDDPESIARRIIVLRTRNAIPRGEVRADMVDVIKAELSGVINVLVRHFQAALRNGEFTVPADNRTEATRMCNGDALVASYLDRVASAPGKRTPSKAFKTGLMRHAQAMGVPPSSVTNGTMRAFKSGVLKRFDNARTLKTSGIIAYEGVELNDDYEAARDPIAEAVEADLNDL